MELRNEELHTVQISVLHLAVKSLIATHPNADQVRREFDQLFAQGMAVLLATGGSSLEAAEFAREIAADLFGQPASES